MATRDPLRLPSHRADKSAGLQVVRKPSLRVRQAVRDNNVALLARLQYKMDLRNTDRMRLTSLAWAAMESNVEVFEWLLLDYGHDDQELSRDADHNTIFHLLAAATAPLAVSPHADLLMSSPDFPPRPPTKTPAELSNACQRMTEVYYTLFPFLVDWSNTSGKTALHVAAQANNPNFLNQMCDLGADVCLADLQGNTPLHYAAAWGHAECIRVLLERGAQVGIRNFDGFTAADYSYSHSVRTALDTIAREVLEERRARKREERTLAKERERAEGEREAYEREMYEREQRDDRSAASHGSRFRSGSASTSASAMSAHSSSHSTPSGVRRGEPEPPLPPLPPSVAKAAAAAALARNERRATERGGPYIDSASSQSHGSPTPTAVRTANGIDKVPTMMLSPNLATPTPGAQNYSGMGSPTPMRPGTNQGPTRAPRPRQSAEDINPTNGTFNPAGYQPALMRRANSSSHAL